MNRIRPWTLALFMLIVLDSIFTMFIGTEYNSSILWFMSTFSVSLNATMLIRIFYILPFLYFLNLYDKCKIAFISYVSVYILFTGVQFI